MSGLQNLVNDCDGRYALEKATTFIMLVAPKDSAGAYYDLTGWTGEFKAVDDDSVTIFEYTTAGGEITIVNYTDDDGNVQTNGAFQIEVAYAVTAELTAGLFDYSFYSINTSAQRMKEIEGKISITESF